MKSLILKLTAPADARSISNGWCSF